MFKFIDFLKDIILPYLTYIIYIRNVWVLGDFLLKVLIVDDNKQITSILEVFAKKEGYETIITLDGEEAIELFNYTMNSQKKNLKWYFNLSPRSILIL